MIEWLYTVKIDDKDIANHMSLNDALIFVKALFQEYYNDPFIKLTLERENKSYGEKMS